MSDDLRMRKLSEKPSAESAGSRPKSSRSESTLFWLEQVFKSPAAVFSLKCPLPTDLAQSAVFVFDTNALFGPFKVGVDSVKNLEEIYRRLAGQNRLFVPAQAVREYAKNRARKIADVYDQVCKKLSVLPSISRLVCPMLEGNKAYEESNRLAEEVKERVKDYKEHLVGLKTELADWGWEDRVSNLYREIFIAERIIDHDQPDDIISNDLTRRISHKIPPGYKDAGKSDEGIGDLLIWYSILKLAKDRNCHVVFVCNEEKADWLVRSNDETLMPRPELTTEFYEATGQHFCMMNWVRFLAVMKADPTTIQEAELVRIQMPGEHSVMEERISTQLGEIAVILNALKNVWLGYPEDIMYCGSEYIHDRLLGFVLGFRGLVGDYKGSVNSLKIADILNELSHILSDIVSCNIQLKHLAITSEPPTYLINHLHQLINKFKFLRDVLDGSFLTHNHSDRTPFEQSNNSLNHD